MPQQARVKRLLQNRPRAQRPGRSQHSPRRPARSHTTHTSVPQTLPKNLLFFPKASVAQHVSTMRGQLPDTCLRLGTRLRGAAGVGLLAYARRLAVVLGARWLLVAWSTAWSMVLHCLMCADDVCLGQTSFALLFIFCDALTRSTRVNFDRPVSPSASFVGSKLVLCMRHLAIVCHSCACE